MNEHMSTRVLTFILIMGVFMIVVGVIAVMMASLNLLDFELSLFVSGGAIITGILMSVYSFLMLIMSE